MRYVKRPVVIEAFQMTKRRRWDNSEWPEWLNEAWQKGPGEGGFWCGSEGDPNHIFLGTLEGICAVTFGDWIIRGTAGELYPCKPDIFKDAYEMVGPCDEADY